MWMKGNRLALSVSLCSWRTSSKKKRVFFLLETRRRTDWRTERERERRVGRLVLHSLRVVSLTYRQVWRHLNSWIPSGLCLVPLCHLCSETTGPFFNNKTVWRRADVVTLGRESVSQEAAATTLDCAADDLNRETRNKSFQCSHSREFSILFEVRSTTVSTFCVSLDVSTEPTHHLSKRMVSRRHWVISQDPLGPAPRFVSFSLLEIFFFFD